MADSWFLKIVSPTGPIDIWPVGDDPELFGGYVATARAELGVPEETEGTGWDISLIAGDLHPSLLANTNVTLHAGPPG